MITSAWAFILLTLILLQSASGTKWEEEAVREAVTKAVTSQPLAGLGGAE
jgi:hypothetical protein